MNDQVQEQVSYEATAIRLMGELEKARRTKRDLNKEMLENLADHPGYAEADEKAKQASQAKKTMRASVVLNNENLMLLDQKLKDLSEDIKTLGDSLNTYLEMHFQQTGKKEIGEGTAKREFSFKAKISPGQLEMF